MPQRSIDELIEGFRAFRREYYEANRPLFEALATRGQSPKVMVIGCADSRADPLMITRAGPGDIFVVRNVANLIPPYGPDQHYHGTSAALEFAVRSLEVAHIVVMGHAQCGGVRALLDTATPAEGRDDFIGRWMSIAEPARHRALAAPGTDEDRHRFCEQETVKVSLDNLRTFPWIAERVAAGQLRLHGWYYDLSRGSLMRLDTTTQAFSDI